MSLKCVSCAFPCLFVLLWGFLISLSMAAEKLSSPSPPPPHSLGIPLRPPSPMDTSTLPLITVETPSKFPAGIDPVSESTNNMLYHLPKSSHLVVHIPLNASWVPVLTKESNVRIHLMQKTLLEACIIQDQLICSVLISIPFAIYNLWDSLFCVITEN